MRYDPDIHHRRSIRLKDFNYAQRGAYFVTMCVQGRECLFGEAVEGHIRLSPAGVIVEALWAGLPGKYPHIALDALVVMPNHFHGILIIREGRGILYSPGMAGRSN